MMAIYSRRKRPKAAADGSSSAQVLPDDLVLEIVARCPTAADVVRCAATSKPIRRGILNEPFLRRLQRFLLRDGRDDGLSIPSVLLGLYYKTGDPDCPPVFAPATGVCAENFHAVAVTALPPARDAGACHYGSYLPVASCRSLLVLRRQCRVTEQEHLTARHGLHLVELSAWNPTTGERVVLPPHDVLDTSHALLDVLPLAPSMAFELLVAEVTENPPRTLHVQIFSSEAGGWGDVLSCRVGVYCELVTAPGRHPASPVVVGDTVNWFCNTSEGCRVLSWRSRGEHKTSLLKLPLSLQVWRQTAETCLAVLPATNGGDAAAGPQQQEAASVLSLIVLERGEIEVWVREKQRGGRRFAWEMRCRVEDTGAVRPRGFGNGWLWHTEIVSFSPGTGALFLRGYERNLVSLVLNSLDADGNNDNTAAKATRWDLQPAGAQFCPYEIDLLTYMLFFMKTF